MQPGYSLLLVGALPDLADALDGLDVEVVSALTAAEACGLQTCGTFSLILCDMEHLDEIREAFTDTPIIVFAPDTSADRLFDAIQKSFALISPPYEPSRIRDLIREALHSPDLPDSIQIISRDPRFITFRIRCSFAAADRLMRFAIQMKSDIPEEDRRDAAMAFREMLLNAIEHGGKLNPDQWVQVCRVRTGRAVIYHIQDPGPGFTVNGLRHAAILNSEESPDEHMKYREEQGMRSGGFGILMARHLVDEVIYSEQGNAVVLVKYLD